MSIDTVDVRKSEYWQECEKHLRNLKDSSLSEKEFEGITESVADISKSLFFDIQILCSNSIFPCHKYVLSLRSDFLRKELSTGTNTLNWTEFKADVGFALLRWIYTDKVDLDSESLALGLLQASFRFQLASLFEASERMLVMCVDEKSYFKFHSIAEKVGANILVERCLQFSQFQNFAQSSEVLVENNKTVNTNLVSPQFQKSRLIDQKNIELANQVGLDTESRTKLTKIVNGICKYLTFSDHCVSRSTGLWPAHEYVLRTHSKLLPSAIHQKNWYASYSDNSLLAVLRWLYTKSFDVDTNELILDILIFSHKTQLFTLMEICEEAICKRVNLMSCAQAVIVARNIQSTKVLQHCADFLSGYWKDVSSVNINDLLNIIRNADERLDSTNNAISEHEQPEISLFTLNDDCLLHIFKFIPLIDLGSIKSTCRKFNNLAVESFISSGNKSLSIITDSIIADIWNLQHFGKLIHSLTIDSHEKFYFWIWDDIFAMVSKFCSSNLKRFSLSFYGDESTTDISLAHLKEILKTVEIIELKYIHPNKPIEFILNHCENLKEVEINHAGKDLSTLWCANNRNIKRLILNNIENYNFMEEICKILLQLEYLDFASFEDLEIDSNRLFPLAKLNHLKQLKIGCNLSDIGLFLQNLAKKNVLEGLSLSYIDMQESEALALGKFTNLKELTLCGVSFKENTLDTLVESLLNFEKLIFDFCAEMTLEDITKIIKNNVQLKELLIIDCQLIEFIDSVNYLKLLKPRNLKIFLDNYEYERTIALIKKDLSDCVQISRIPSDWIRWHEQLINE